MATSSIFYNVVIKTPLQADRLVKAMDDSMIDQEPKRKRVTNPVLEDQDKIKALLKKGGYI